MGGNTEHQRDSICRGLLGWIHYCLANWALSSGNILSFGVFDLNILSWCSFFLSVSFLKAPLAKKQRIKAQQSQGTQDALVAVCAPCYTPRREGQDEGERDLGCAVLGQSQIGGGKNPPGDLHCQFLSVKTTTLQFFQGSPHQPLTYTHLTPRLTAITTSPFLSFTFKCFAALRGVIPATCPPGQPVPPSSPKAQHINKCRAIAGWNLS